MQNDRVALLQNKQLRCAFIDCGLFAWIPLDPYLPPKFQQTAARDSKVCKWYWLSDIEPISIAFHQGAYSNSYVWLNFTFDDRGFLLIWLLYQWCRMYQAPDQALDQGQRDRQHLTIEARIRYRLCDRDFVPHKMKLGLRGCPFFILYFSITVTSNYKYTHPSVRPNYTKSLLSWHAF